jgi:hypothetical protein
MVGMAFTLWWAPVVRHHNYMMTPGDIWGTFRSAHVVGWGNLGGIYASGTALVSFPGFVLLLAPVAMLTGAFHMTEDFPFYPPHASAWYVLGPFEMLVSCVALFACDALAQRLGVSQTRRMFMAVAGAVALWNVSIIWGHPEDALAIALAVYALVFALDDRWTGAGWLFGAAVAVQPLVLLVLPVLVGMAGRENAVKVIARSIVPAVAVVFTPLVANFHATAQALLQQPNFPNIDHVTPWTSLAPVVAGSGKGLEVAAGPGRVVALVLACGLGFVATRWRGRPDVLVWAVCAALTLRCLTESVMDPFYIWPPIAIALVVAARSSAWRFAAVAVVACASTAVSNWHLGEWLWWGLVTGIVVFIVTVSVPQKAKDGERPLELKLDAQCADEVQRTFVPAFGS